MAGSSSIWAARLAPIRSIIFARSLGAVAIDPTMILRICPPPLTPLPLLLRDVAKSAEGETAETRGVPNCNIAVLTFRGGGPGAPLVWYVFPKVLLP